VIEVEDLTVRFGGVMSIDQMSVTFPSGTCGLIGPNGAGKTTFLNVLSGFVRPAAGRVAAFGDDLLVLSDYERARWGVRRTFQTEQAIEALTVYDNVLTVHEHTTKNERTGKMRAERRSAVLDAIAFVGLGDVAFAKVGSLSPRQRRLVEVARAVVGGPRAVLLDEPGAGLPEAETEHLGAVISAIHAQVGAMVVLVEHDMSLVRACCEWTAVLDFGRLLSSGPTDEVLRDPEVLKAYLGQEELE
jgi:ABC-type branched-subunit amino acid transport system ATPase component